MDLAVAMTISDADVRTAVLDTFYVGLAQSIEHGGIDFLKDRLARYTTAANTPHPNGIAAAVGSQVAQLTVGPSAVIMLAGAADFTGTYTAVKNTLKEFRIL